MCECHCLINHNGAYHITHIQFTKPQRSFHQKSSTDLYFLLSTALFALELTSTDNKLQQMACLESVIHQNIENILIELKINNMGEQNLRVWCRISYTLTRKRSERVCSRSLNSNDRFLRLLSDDSLGATNMVLCNNRYWYIVVGFLVSVW